MQEMTEDLYSIFVLFCGAGGQSHVKRDPAAYRRSFLVVVDGAV
jgi:hypothetical protein